MKSPKLKRCALKIEPEMCDGALMLMKVRRTDVYNNLAVFAGEGHLAARVSNET